MSNRSANWPGPSPSRTAEARDQKRRLFNHAMANRKLALGCADCGWRGHPAALEFDHLPGFVKRFQISRAQSHNVQTVLEEIAKCEVICANHHAIRTAERR